MMPITFRRALFPVLLLPLFLSAAAPEKVAPGVWRVRIGEPETFTPCAVREKQPDLEGLKRLPDPPPLPFELTDIRGSVTSARTVVGIPCDARTEQIYGFGLDPQAYEQKGLRKYLPVCAGVMGKTGASHGPVPFYLSTKGYGVYVDTARVPFVHVARLSPAAAAGASPAADKAPATSVAALYAARPAQGRTEVVFEIPGDSRGVDVYVFEGPTPREVVRKRPANTIYYFRLS